MLKFRDNTTLGGVIRLLLISLLIFGVVGSALARDAPAKLGTSTKKCVTLNKGNVCHKDVLITWKHEVAGNFCLVSSQRAEPIECWDNSSGAELHYKLESTDDVQFQLQERKGGKLIATATVRVVWVYKQDPKSQNSWRLF